MPSSASSRNSRRLTMDFRDAETASGRRYAASVGYFDKSAAGLRRPAFLAFQFSRHSLAICVRLPHRHGRNATATGVQSAAKEGVMARIFWSLTAVFSATVRFQGLGPGGRRPPRWRIRCDRRRAGSGHRAHSASHHRQCGGVRAFQQLKPELAARALSDKLIAEVRAADIIVIGAR